MFAWTLLDRELCLQVALVLWNVTWSAALLGTAALGAARLGTRTPRGRYAVLCGGLASIAIVTLLWSGLAFSGRARTTAEAAFRSQEAALPIPASDPQIADPSLAERDWSLPPEAPRPDHDGVDVDTVLANSLPRLEVFPSVREKRFEEWIAEGVTWTYLAGVVAMLARFGVGLWAGERLRQSGRPVAAPEILQRLAAEARRLGLASVPALRTCERIGVPVVLGILRPVLLIPAVMLTGLTPDQFDAVVAHELAHLRRRDHLVLLAQRLIETFLFFHPVVWLLSRQIDVAREECCDDLVLAQGGDPVQYATSLLRVAEMRLGPASQTNAGLAALSADGGRPSELRRRILRVLGGGSTPAPVLRLTRRGMAGLAAVLAGAVSLSWFVAAEEQKPLEPEVVAAADEQDDEPDTPAGPTIARFEDGIEAELIGLADLDGRAWWTAEGEPLDRKPKRPLGASFSGLPAEQLKRCRELWLTASGVESSVRYVVEVNEGMGPAVGEIVYDSAKRLHTVRRAGAAPPTGTPTTIRFGLSLVDTLPLRTIDRDGTKFIPPETTPAVRALDDLVEVIRIRRDGGDIELVMKQLDRLGKRAIMEIVALDVDGKELPRSSSWGSLTESGIRFAVTDERFARFGYRLRPYTHWATFEGVAIDPAKPEGLRRKRVRVTSQILSEFLPPAPKTDAAAGAGAPDLGTQQAAVRRIGERMAQWGGSIVATVGDQPLEKFGPREQIGIDVRFRQGRTFVSTIAGAALLDGRLQVGDEILGVGESELAIVSLAESNTSQEVLDKIAGFPGTKVWLSIRPMGSGEPRKYEIVREPAVSGSKPPVAGVPEIQVRLVRPDDAVLDELLQIPDMTTLQILGARRVLSLTALQRLPRLASLSLTESNGRIDTLSLKELPRLKRLDLTNSGITIPGEFTPLDLLVLKQLPGLQSFRASLVDQRVNSVEPPRQQLNATGTTPVSYSDLAPFRRVLPALTETQQALLDGELRKSKTGAETELFCYRAFLADWMLTEAPSLPALQSFDLAGTAVTDAGFAKLTALPDLRVLRLDGRLLTEQGLRTLRRCATLESLDLAGAPWTPAALAELKALERLRTLRLTSSVPGVRLADLKDLQRALPRCEIDITVPAIPPPLEFRLVPTPEIARSAPNEQRLWPRFLAETQFRSPGPPQFALYRSSLDPAPDTRPFPWTPAQLSGDDKDSNATQMQDRMPSLLYDDPEMGLPADGTWTVLDAKLVRRKPGLAIQVRLDPRGGRKLRELTRAHLNEDLAILVAGRVAMKPTIRSEVGESIEITGNFSEEQAETLVQVIRKGIPDATAEPEVKKEANDKSPTMSVSDRLTLEVEIDAQNKPLIHVLSEIETKYGLPITIDLREMRRLGISPHALVLATLSKVPLRFALECVLNSADTTLDFAVTETGVRIPAQDSSEDKVLLQTKVVSRELGTPILKADVVVEYRDADWKVQRDTAQPGGYQPPLAIRRLRTDEHGEMPLLLPKICEGRDLAVSRSVAHPDHVSVTSSGYRSLSRSLLENPQDLEASFGKITMEEARIVDGTVRHADGSPAARVPLFVAREYIDYVGSPPTTVTDDRGHYVLRVSVYDEDLRLFVLPWSSVDQKPEIGLRDQPLTRPWRTPALPPEREFCGVSVPIGKGPTLPRIELLDGVPIRGRVLDSEGRGVANVAVQGDGGDSVFHGKERPLLIARTDRDGRYSLPPVPPGRTIDVRVRDEGWFGNWLARGAVLQDAYLPARSPEVPKAGERPAEVTLDFRPVPFVKLTARCFEGNEPRNSAHLEFYGNPPGEPEVRWRGRFHDVPGQPGVFELRVPRGLTDAALDLWQDGEDRSAAATRLAGPGERKAGERVEVRYAAVTADDDTIEVRSPARPE